MTDRELIINYLKENLSEKRYNHILGVEKRINELGDIYNLEKEKLMYVALLHDISKEMPDEWQIKNLRIQGIDEDDYPRESWHAFTAKCIYKGLLNIDDSEIDHAINYHPICHEEMSDIGKALVVADFTEENRKFEEAKLLYNNFGKKTLDELVILKLQYISKFLNNEEVTKRNDYLIKIYGG